MANNKNTLVQRIALDGGADIKKELESLGDEGKKAFASLKKNADDLAASSKGLNGFLSNMRTQFKAIGDGAGQVSKGMKDISSGITTVTRNVTLFAGAIAGAGVALFAYEKHAADAVDEQQKAAQAAGLTLEAYGKLQFVFEQSNVNAEQFGVAMKSLNKQVVAAAQGTGPAADLFKKLGVNVKDGNGNLRSGEAILQDLAGAFAKLPDGAAKSTAALTLFGKSGATMVAALDDGKKAFIDLENEASKLGLSFTKNEAVAADALGDSVNALSRGVDALGKHFALLFAPAITLGFTDLTKILEDNRDTILQFGQTIADNVIPIINDLFKIIEGKDSEVANKNLLAIRDTLSEMAQAFHFVFQAGQFVFGALVDAIQPFVDIINGIFGTKLTAQTVIFEVALSALLGVFSGIAKVAEGAGLVFRGLSKIFGQTAAKVIAITTGAIAATGIFKALGNAFFDFLDKTFGAAFRGIQSLLGISQKSALDWAKGALKPAADAATGLDAATTAATASVDTLNTSMADTSDSTDAATNSVDLFKKSTDSATQSGDALAKGAPVWFGSVGNSAQNANPHVVQVGNELRTVDDTVKDLGDSKGAIDDLGKSIGNLDPGSQLIQNIALLNKMFHDLSQYAQLADAQAKNAADYNNTISQNLANSVGHAEGGRITGPGTGTSDSILARLSNGEFVMKAKAVRKYGLGLMASINGMRFKGFNMGGLVSGLTSPMISGGLPSFATGGLAESAGRPLSLTIGGEVFEGLMAPDSIADRMVRFATSKQVRSNGVKPRWYR